jgi:hypothetical protein
MSWRDTRREDLIEEKRKKARNRGDSTYLANGFEGTRGYLHSHVLAKGVGEEPFGLDVGEPRPTRLLLRERDVVPVLLCLSVEQAKL